MPIPRRRRNPGQLSVYEIPAVAEITAEPEPPVAPLDWSAAASSPRGAWFSDDGLHRLLLWRSWGRGARALFVMLNPSSAGGEVDDPTVRRCCGFARAWGATGIWIVNLYTLIATDPGELWSTEPALRQIRSSTMAGAEPEPRADWYIERALDRTTGPIIAAWGALPRENAAVIRAADVTELLARRRVVHCLGTTATGYPRHPVRLSGTTELVVFRSPFRLMDAPIG
jgi:hypothetical protein